MTYFRKEIEIYNHVLANDWFLSLRHPDIKRDVVPIDLLITPKHLYSTVSLREYIEIVNRRKSSIVKHKLMKHYACHMMSKNKLHESRKKSLMQSFNYSNENEIDYLYYYCIYCIYSSYNPYFSQLYHHRFKENIIEGIRHKEEIIGNVVVEQHEDINEIFREFQNIFHDEFTKNYGSDKINLIILYSMIIDLYDVHFETKFDVSAEIFLFREYNTTIISSYYRTNIAEYVKLLSAQYQGSNTLRRKLTKICSKKYATIR